MDHDILSCTRPQKMALSSQRLRNPFLLKIDPQSLKVDNYVDGITMSIVCECSFWFFSFWAVKIKEFHEKLVCDWNTIRNQLIDNKFLTNIANHSNDPELYRDEYNKIVHKISVPENFDKSFFTTTPRDRYPLVVILLLNDRDIEDQIQGNDIVLLVSIIHLKDSLVPLETSIIGQYIKRKSGVVLNLQDLYICSEKNEEYMPFCVICLEERITRAFLPCRHACVCSDCLEKINLCPLCRCPIQNFIIINQPVSTSNIQNDNSNNQSNKKDGNQRKKETGLLDKFQKFLGL